MLMNLTHWARFKGLHKVTVIEYIKAGRLPVIRYGKRCTLIDSEAVILPNPLSKRKPKAASNKEQP